MPDLKPPLKGYSLWLEAYEPDQTLLQTLVYQLAQQHLTRSFGAHTTLIGLLDKDKSDLDAIEQACRQLASNFHDISTEIVGVGMRDAYFQSVFLPIVPSAELAAMNQQARTLLGHENDPPFMPHWSAVYGDLIHATKRQIATTLRWALVSFPRIVRLKNIALVDVQGHPNEWTVLERYFFE